MSIELAKAFCVRLMSDDEFRDAVGRAASAKEIADLHKARIKAYGENGDFCIKVTL